MQAVVGDDPFDAALADGMTLLPDFLSDDGGGRIWVEKATTDGQADDLVGAAVIGFGSRGLQQQPLGAFFIKSGQDLVIALAGEIVSLSGLGRAEALTLAFDEHGQAAADFVVIGDQQGSARACETELFFGERNIHGGRVWRRVEYVK